MRIIIAGAGEVGFHLARLLATEAQDIILIDVVKERLDYAQTLMDVDTIKGDSTSFATLKEAGIGNTDMLISVTSSEDTNLATCIIGKKLGAKKTIARITNTEYLRDKETLDLRTIGIDELICLETLAAREIKRLLRESVVTESFDFEEGKLSFIGILLPETAPSINKTLTESAKLNPKNNFVTVAIHREGETIIPRGDTLLKPGDHVYFITLPDGIDDVLKFAGKERLGIKNVMILGGSKTGVHTARRLSKRYKVKLIEENREKSFELADELPNVLVINGDGTSSDLMEEEGIQGMDAFVALTSNSETNIIAALLAKNWGVAKAIALVENVEYIKLSQSIGLDTMINKKLIAADFISRYIRKGEVVSLTRVHNVDAEILEFKVKENSRITEKRIKDLNFPHGAIIGGVVRQGEGLIALGDFQIQPGDRVVVLSLNKWIHDIEDFF
jgi:trk system potassium uptake protein TrkA